MNGLDDLMLTRAPTARRPLLGLTVLVVEDSRYACEALRMLCLRSGARIRRADSLENAHRHLTVYRPTVLLVDVGLPDGSGLELIRSLAESSGRIDVIIGISGDTAVEPDVMKAGADGFIAKPIENLAEFQNAILRHLPAERQPPVPREIPDEIVTPDPVAYHDDLNHIAQVLADADGSTNLDYVTQFLSGVARSASDDELDLAIRDLDSLRQGGANLDASVAALSEMVQSRIAASGPL
ncbi:response regulator [Yoonia sediminilitoris]|uniref:Response regulator receiver domain-containing protein n=1 Tax=Yoonia sediminilitoris TaxID=1286148 RepID=A0A2T6KBD6_9RHOB|nr:response regulator [Yoonia sediminilitoris]PUB12160.1 response regulator receiver domain-containing protein [Yoonia sediminilitoris]RCW92987.1 response regulator receiver domain-containing protein [Yoonia sediminilitoris]